MPRTGGEKKPIAVCGICRIRSWRPAWLVGMREGVGGVMALRHAMRAPGNLFTKLGRVVNRKSVYLAAATAVDAVVLGFAEPLASAVGTLGE
ncbi:hypothetical protein GCM10010319_45900 [Streptomyces blastmyceticus]|uniref:Uncharacterized protein n=1 Tax=Streptomyces blastmyceticus TaxID=68180 RepID=A0ABP3H633_9ACTN